jgi:hypothetical protein
MQASGLSLDCEFKFLLWSVEQLLALQLLVATSVFRLSPLFRLLAYLQGSKNLEVE